VGGRLPAPRQRHAVNGVHLGRAPRLQTHRWGCWSGLIRILTMAVAQKPEGIPAYEAWLRTAHSIEISGATRSHYQSVTERVKIDLEQSGAWRSLVAAMREFGDEYLTQTTYQLFTAEPTLPLSLKSFDSFLLKTYRRNVIENRKWPDPPDSGWLLPTSGFSAVNDLIRTNVVVKYLDGIKFLTTKFVAFAAQNQLESKVDFEARPEGYYAAHVYLTREFEIPRPNWDTEKANISVEIQVTSQLQDVLGRLTHPYYELRRVRLREPEEKWQWIYDSEEFVPNYLGHILHYVEGMIMEVRERLRENK
jgi:hypothetical protein